MYETTIKGAGYLLTLVFPKEQARKLASLQNYDRQTQRQTQRLTDRGEV